MTSRWKLEFPCDHGTVKGFAEHEDEHVNDEIVARELVQNALDNTRNGQPCEVVFELESWATKDIPCLSDYRIAFGNVLPELKQGTTGKRISDKISKALNTLHVDVLMCRDYGTGLDEAGYKSLISSAATTKTGGGRSAVQRGSVGVGHKTVFEVSDLRYVLYASNGPDGVTRFGGQAYLATHKAANGYEHRSEHGCVIDRRKASNGERLRLWDDPLPSDRPPGIIGLPSRRGTTVCVLAYNPIKKPDKLAETTLAWVAKHFFVAVAENQLTVEYHHKPGKPHRLDSDALAAHMQRAAKQKRAPNHHRDLSSGLKAEQAHKTWTEGKLLPTADRSLKGTQIKFRRVTDRTCVTVCRGGMYVTNTAPKLKPQDFGDYNHFNAVVNADGGDLEQAMRDCETGSHLRLDVSNRIHSTQSKRLKKLLGAVAEELKHQAGEIVADKWVPTSMLRFHLNGSNGNESKPAPRRSRTGEDQDAESRQPDEEGQPERHTRKRRARTNRSQTVKLKPGADHGIRCSVIPPPSGRVSTVLWEYNDNKTPRTPYKQIQVSVMSGSDDASDKQIPGELLRIRLPGAGRYRESLTVPTDITSTDGHTKVEVMAPPQGWESVSVVVAGKNKDG